MTQPLLEVEDLRCSFMTPHGEVRAVDGVSFAIDAGESLGVVGESGSGKTVTAMSVLQLFPLTSKVRLSGRILFEGVDLLRAGGRRLRQVRGGEIGVVFQDPLTSLDPVMPVGDQIAEGIVLHKGVSKAVARNRAIELLERVGIPDAAQRSRDLPHHFSGGMRQRIMIAIAISCEPKLLIADEATTALDATVQAQVLALLDDLRRESGMATMVISHDIGVIAAVCDEAQVMYAGRIAERGPVRSLLTASSHPYTTALLHLVPRLDHRTHHRLRPIPGSPPLVAGDAVGCRFAARCELAMAQCAQTPPLVTVGDRHVSACWLSGDPMAESDRASETQEVREHSVAGEGIGTKVAS
jgi:oligopeptide/dipeptide ABC transporter ATP-binding protein